MLEYLRAAEGETTISPATFNMAVEQHGNNNLVLATGLNNVCGGLGSKRASICMGLVQEVDILSISDTVPVYL